MENMRRCVLSAAALVCDAVSHVKDPTAAVEKLKQDVQGIVGTLPRIVIAKHVKLGNVEAILCAIRVST